MLAVLFATVAVTAAMPGAAPGPAPANINEIAPVDVVAPRPTAAKSHQQVVADRWSPRIVTCRGVFVQNIGVVRRVCATNRDWELEGQRFRHSFMQAQWHWAN